MGVCGHGREIHLQGKRTYCLEADTPGRKFLVLMLFTTLDKTSPGIKVP